MRVLLAFPFRDTDGSRTPQYLQTQRCLWKMYPWDGIVECDSGHVKFNRAATRNEAVFYAFSHNYDVIVLNDADTVPEEQPLNDAIRGAYTTDVVHYPFTTAYELIPKAMYQVGIQAASILVQRAYGKCQSEGGIWVCKPEVWVKAGGQDERFNGWGCEDRAFIAANKTLVGDPVKHQGALFCMYHDRTTNNEDSWIPEEVQLLIQYNDAFMDKEKMREIIDGRAYNSRTKSPATEKRSPTVRELPRDMYR